MSVRRTRKAVAAVAATFVMSGLLMLADQAGAADDSRWDAGATACANQPTLPGCPDDSRWD